MAHNFAEVLRRKKTNNAVQNKWHRRQKPGGHLAFRTECSHLKPKFDALPHKAREPSKDFREISAGLALDRYRDDQKKKVVLPDAAVEIVHGCCDVLTKGHFIGHHAEFRSDRIWHFLRHEVDC